LRAIATAYAPPVDDPAVAAWQQRRSELMHDWLRNRFLPRLQACLAAPGAEASSLLLERFQATPHEWQARSAEIRTLAEDCVEVMSPRRLADDVAAALDRHTAQFIRSTAFDLWVLRRGILPTLADVRETCDAADDAYARWAAEPSPIHLRALAERCERVASAIAKLPARPGL
jgi:hypothetical protein